MFVITSIKFQSTSQVFSSARKTKVFVPKLKQNGIEVQCKEKVLSFMSEENKKENCFYFQLASIALLVLITLSVDHVAAGGGGGGGHKTVKIEIPYKIHTGAKKFFNYSK